MSQIKVVTLETAKRLRKAGFPQEAQFYYWLTEPDKYALSIRTENKIEALDGSTYFTTYDHKNDELFAAPSADNVLDQLPEILKTKSSEYRLFVVKEYDFYRVFYYQPNIQPLALQIEYQMGFSSTLPEAASLMWLHLKQNKLL